MIMYPMIVLGFFILYLLSSIKILREYERGVIFRLGRLLPKAKGPGLILVFGPIDRMVRMGLRIITLEIPPQDVITKDNVSVKVSAGLRSSTPKANFRPPINSSRPQTSFPQIRRLFSSDSWAP